MYVNVFPVDKSNYAQCPFNDNHKMPQRRLQYHLVKCPDRKLRGDMVCCPHNRSHIILRTELDSHIRECPEKPQQVMKPEELEREQKIRAWLQSDENRDSRFRREEDLVVCPFAPHNVTKSSYFRHIHTCPEGVRRRQMQDFWFALQSETKTRQERRGERCTFTIQFGSDRLDVSPSVVDPDTSLDELRADLPDTFSTSEELPMTPLLEMCERDVNFPAGTCIHIATFKRDSNEQREAYDRFLRSHMLSVPVYRIPNKPEVYWLLCPSPYRERLGGSKSEAKDIQVILIDGEYMDSLIKRERQGRAPVQSATQELMSSRDVTDEMIERHLRSKNKSFAELFRAAQQFDPTVTHETFSSSLREFLFMKHKTERQAAEAHQAQLEREVNDVNDMAPVDQKPNDLPPASDDLALQAQAFADRLSSSSSSSVQAPVSNRFIPVDPRKAVLRSPPSQPSPDHSTMINMKQEIIDDTEDSPGLDLNIAPSPVSPTKREHSAERDPYTTAVNDDTGDLEDGFRFPKRQCIEDDDSLDEPPFSGIKDEVYLTSPPISTDPRRPPDLQQQRLRVGYPLPRQAY
eukprot:GILJ01009320.1.p1 GENE.GILJ01009320.1~~GILJ01009320.1.p1  ORF type:complete len:574 (-),score=64.93 GILJ01009320.1:155-1876(-)